MNYDALFTQSHGMNQKTLTIDGVELSFEPGQTIMEAATASGVYIPHLCHHPEFKPHGSCKLCTVKVNGRFASACTLPAAEGQEVLNETLELKGFRTRITQMLFVEGNHFCPGCEISGQCKLQATAYSLGMVDSHFPHFFPVRRVDASHPDIMLDLDRCILCELCVRASRDRDGKSVFGIAGRGMKSHLVVNTESGALVDTSIDVSDRAVNVCPVGAILIKHKAYDKPIGQRRYDHHPIQAILLHEDQGDGSHDE